MKKVFEHNLHNHDVSIKVKPTEIINMCIIYVYNMNICITYGHSDDSLREENMILMLNIFVTKFALAVS